MTFTVSAPGKVVLLGEYAVLEGAPALVMAVNRRVQVALEARTGPGCSVSAPGWTTGTARFELGPAGATWATGNDPVFDLARHVIHCFFEGLINTAAYPAFHLELDSHALTTPGPSGPEKLGLGSSAALTVALWHALSYYAAMQQAGHRSVELAELIRIHAAFQNDRGSGLDVAASLHGGLIAYRRTPQPHAKPSRLPADVGYCFVWSGRQAVTGQFLAGLDQWRDSQPGTYQCHMDSLMALSEAGVRAAAGGESEECLRLVEEYASALEALGRASGADILSAPHRELRELARRSGVVYKPCGAGGGDIGVALSRDPGALARFRDALASGRFQPLPLRIDESGVTTHSGN